MFIHITITDDILYKMPTYITYTVQNIYSHNIYCTKYLFAYYMYIVLYKMSIHKMHNVQNMCIVQYCTVLKRKS